jgi:hypothetical protein
MADSDYESDSVNGSDEEYVGSRASSVPRAQTAGAKKAQPKATERKAHAWARRGSTPPEEEYEYVPAEDEEEGEDLVPQKSLQHIEEERKRKRYVETLLTACSCDSNNANRGLDQVTKRHETLSARYYTARRSRTRFIRGDE